MTAKAHDWVAARVFGFSIFNGEGVPSSARLKAVVELCLTAAVTRRAEPDSPYLPLMIESCKAEIAVLQQSSILLDRSDLWSLGLPAVALLAEIDGGTPELVDTLMTKIDVRYLLASELSAYHKLETLYFLSKLQRIQGNLVWQLANERLWNQTILAAILDRRFSSLYMNLADVYAITHTILYATDFGRTPTLPGGSVADCRMLLKILLAEYIRLCDTDIVAELVAALYCIGDVPTELDDLAWRLLGTVQVDDGHVPHGRLPSAPCKLLADGMPFSVEYHSTLATIIAGRLRQQIQS